MYVCVCGFKITFSFNRSFLCVVGEKDRNLGSVGCKMLPLQLFDGMLINLIDCVGVPFFGAKNKDKTRVQTTLQTGFVLAKNDQTSYYFHKII